MAVTDNKDNQEDTSLATLTNKPLAIQGKEITDRIIKETDPEKLKDLTYLFNIAQAKKSVVRADKLNDLYDKVADAVTKRIEKQPDNFTNMELLNYIQALQNSIEKSIQQTNYVNNPAPVQITQQNVQVNLTDGKNFDRASRERILNAVKTILSAQEIQNGFTMEESKVDTDGVYEVQAEEVKEENKEEDSKLQ